MVIGATRFKKLVFENRSSYRKDKLFRSLYDEFFKLESGKYISRPNFEVCIENVCGYSTRVRQERTALDSLYSTFDELGNGSFDWRRFLFFLHFVLNPTMLCEEHILWAFSIIASHDGIENDSAMAWVDLSGLEAILYPLVSADMVREAMSIMDDAWAHTMTSYSLSTNTVTRITKDILIKMLYSINHLFKQQSSSSWGRGLKFPVFICKWEQKFYNKRLLHVVKHNRRDRAIYDKLARDDSVMRKFAFGRWKAFTLYQSSLRSILIRVDTKFRNRMIASGLLGLSHWNQQQESAVQIQRVFRGILGSFEQLCSRYLFAVIEIQRHIRGALGRRIAFKRLMQLVDTWRKANTEEKERLMLQSGERSLVKLQSLFRRKKASTLAKELHNQRRREQDIQHAMDLQRKSFLRERKIYERQLENFYMSMKDEHENNQLLSSKIAKDQIRIRTLRRRIYTDELKNANPDNSEDISIQEWKKDWELRISKGVDDIKAHSIHCLKNPDNSNEKKIRASIRKRVKRRIPHILARADARNIPMETKEAEEIARTEILEIIGEEEKARLRSMMDLALAEQLKEREEAKQQARIAKARYDARSEVHAISLVGRACRKWLARKKLRLLCLEAFEKNFDPIHHAFFYTNVKTGESNWLKPRAMGIFDIPAKDEWILLRDAHNFPYYFNPSSMEMRWNPPPHLDMCCNKNFLHTWWNEFPIRTGPCPNFAIFERDGKLYCSKCNPTQI
ncbi:hypothetical protein ACHAXS_007429 [Conticribra weissflogii]